MWHRKKLEAGNRTQKIIQKAAEGIVANHAMTVDLTKIEEIVNGTLGSRLKSVAIAKK